MRGRDKFNRYKNIIVFLVKGFSLLPHGARSGLFEFFRMTNGNKGLIIRYILLKTLAKECGDNVAIHPNVYLFGLKNLSIGSNVSIHPMCYIDAFGTIEIGDDVSIAHSTTILSTEHSFKDININIKDQDIICKKTIIKSNMWIGAGCRVLAGAVFENGSILPAGAVKTIIEKIQSMVEYLPNLLRRDNYARIICA